MNKLRKSMGLLLPAMRLAIALALLSACILLTADMFGFTPDEDKIELDTRKQIATALGGTLAGNSTLTAFAVGTLRRDDIELLVVRDSF